MKHNKFNYKGDKDHVNIVPIGDIHIGNKTTDLTYLQKALDFCDQNRENTRIVLMGDLLECATKVSVGRGVFDENMNLQDQLDKAIDTFSPYKDMIDVVINGNHCYSDKTEVLTSEGWMKIQDVTDDHYVAQFDADTLEMSYAYPTNLINKEVDHVVSIESFFTKQVVSDEHDVVLTHGRKVKAIDLLNHELYQSSIPLAIKYNGPKTYDVSNDEIQLITWIMFAGKFTHDRRKCFPVELYIDAHAKQKDKVFSHLLKRLDVKVAKRQAPNAKSHAAKVYTAVSGDLITRLYKELKNATVLPDYFSELDYEDAISVLRIISLVNSSSLEVAVKPVFQARWDLWTPMGILKENYMLGVKLYSSQQANVLLTMCVRNGIISRIAYRREAYEEVHERFMCYFQYHMEPDVIDYRVKVVRKRYHGKVYCMTMPKGTLVTRIDGKTGFSGNCERIVQMTSLNVLKEFSRALDIPKSWAEFSAMYSVGIGKQWYTSYVWHGATGGTKEASAVTAMLNMRHIAMAHIYLMGHTHKLLYVDKSIYIPSKDGVDTFNQVFMNTGTCVLSEKGYGEMKGFEPTVPGFGYLILSRDKFEIQFRKIT
jgi:hypothetical protein